MTDKRASLLLRAAGKSIDLIMILAAMEALPKAGWLAGLIYLLVGDGVFGGQSIGKKLTGTMAMTTSGAACTVKESIIRNSTLAVGLLLLKIPYAGWLLLAAVFVLEFLIMLGSSKNARLGDELAGTSVMQLAEAVEEA